MPAQPSIRRLSTRAVPAGERVEYFMRLMRESMWPVSEWNGIARDFSVDLQEAQLGCLTSVVEVMRGLPHSRRTRRDVDNSSDSCYCLITTDQRVDWAHNGHRERLDSGDLVLLGQGEQDSNMAEGGFQSNVLKMPAHWLESWLPDPHFLVGRRIPKESRWGRVLGPMVRQLTPEVVAAPPLPHQVLVDQVGATLALIAGEAEGLSAPDMLKKIQECIHERCAEPQLTAADVAASLNLAPRLVHKALAANKATFASELVNARISVATKLLTSSSFAELAISDIARQAGFMSPAYLARAVRNRTGHTPTELLGQTKKGSRKRA
jgi:AraC family transcriptional regulator, positive regulator of tynA and feaB